MILEFGSQYRGYNNGDLEATWKRLSKTGWKSKDTIHKALIELECFGIIIKTRQGGLNKCSLYALTFLPINGNAKLDYSYNVSGKKYPAPNLWREVKPKLECQPGSRGNGDQD